jgi:hypothetical protein
MSQAVGSQAAGGLSIGVASSGEAWGWESTVSGSSDLLPGMSCPAGSHRIGFIGDFTERCCLGPSKLKKAFLADAQALRKVAGQPQRDSSNWRPGGSPWVLGLLVGFSC